MIRKNFASNWTLAQLQLETNDDEPGFGPVELLEIGSENGHVTTAISYDDSVIVLNSVTALRVSGHTGPNNQIPYTRGLCLISGVQQMIVGFVPRDRVFLTQRIVAVMSSLGWSTNQSIGISANISAESSYSVDAVGDGGNAYGLCQWHPPRQARFQAHFGSSIQGTTFREQLVFIDRELRTAGQEDQAGNALRLATSVEDAAEIVCRKYERPADPDGATNIRRALATALRSSLR